MQEDEEINLDGIVSVDDQVEGMDIDNKDGLLDALNIYLSTPRFDDDECVVLSMPENNLKRAREKVNSAIWYVYNRVRYSGFGLMDILLAMETMVEAPKLAALLDNEVKLAIAREREIEVSEEELDEVASRPVEVIHLEPEPGEMPDEDAEIMEGLL